MRPGTVVQNFKRHEKGASQVASSENSHCNAGRDMNGGAARSSQPSAKAKETLIKSLLTGRDALEARPSAAKAACVAGSDGMAEAMPFQSSPWANLIRVSLRFWPIASTES